MFASRRLFNLILALAAVGMGAAAYAAIGPPAAAKATVTTSTVRRGTVLSTVSSTGNVSPATQLSLTFGSSGTVSEIDVKPGQRVTAGQVLAKIQNDSQSAALAAARASYSAAVAKLAQTTQGVTPQQATADQIGLQQAAMAVTNAQTGVTNAQTAAQNDLATLQAAVTTAKQSLSDTQAAAAADAVNQQQAVNVAQQGVSNAESNAAEDAAQQAAQVSQAQTKLGCAQTQVNLDEGYSSSGGSWSSGAPYPSANCSTAQTGNSKNLSADQSAEQSAQDGLTNAQTAQQSAATKDAQSIQSALNGLTNAQNAQSAAAIKDQQSINQASNAVTTAENNVTLGQQKDQQAIATAQQQLASAQLSQQSTAANNAIKEAPALPSDLSTAQAGVDSARGQLDAAQLTYNNTILTAPVGGTVATVTGVVGGSSGGSSSSSSSTSSGSSGSSSTSSAGSAGSGFITLTDLNSLQVVSGFSETDAAKVQVGQPATVTLNALPNVSLQGTVSQIDTDSTVVSNVVTYNVTVSIVNPPPSLRPGMTANVAVTTAEASNVLTLPTSAVTARGSTATVQVQGTNGKPVAKTITIGLRGDTAIEITSGLAEGDKVITSQTATTSTGTGARAGAGAGLGGGAIFGGGAPGGGGAVRGGG